MGVKTSKSNKLEKVQHAPFDRRKKKIIPKLVGDTHVLQYKPSFVFSQENMKKDFSEELQYFMQNVVQTQTTRSLARGCGASMMLRMTVWVGDPRLIASEDRLDTGSVDSNDYQNHCYIPLVQAAVRETLEMNEFPGTIIQTVIDYVVPSFIAKVYFEYNRTAMGGVDGFCALRVNDVDMKGEAVVEGEPTDMNRPARVLETEFWSRVLIAREVELATLGPIVEMLYYFCYENKGFEWGLDESHWAKMGRIYPERYNYYNNKFVLREENPNVDWTQISL